MAVMASLSPLRDPKDNSTSEGTASRGPALLREPLHQKASGTPCGCERRGRDALLAGAHRRDSEGVCRKPGVIPSSLRPEVRTMGPMLPCGWVAPGVWQVQGRWGKPPPETRQQRPPPLAGPHLGSGCQVGGCWDPSPGSTHTSLPSLCHAPWGLAGGRLHQLPRAHSCRAICSSAGGSGPCALSQRPCWPQGHWRCGHWDLPSCPEQGGDFGIVGLEGPSEAGLKQELVRWRPRLGWGGLGHRGSGWGRAATGSFRTHGLAWVAALQPSPSPQDLTPGHTRDWPAALPNKMQISKCLAKGDRGEKSL